MLELLTYRNNQNKLLAFKNRLAMSRMRGLLFLSHFCVALAAVNRAVLTRLERNLCLAAAGSANSSKHLAFLSCSVLARITASFASLRLVHEAFFCVELLLTSSKYKFRATFFVSNAFFKLTDLIILPFTL